MNIEESVMIDRPVEVVWKFISDLSNFPRMYPDVHEIRQTSPGPFGVGATFSGKQGRWTFLLRVTEYEPSREFAYEFAGPEFVKGTTDKYRLETLERSARLTETIDMKLNGFYRLMALFLARRGRSDIGARLGRVKRTLETEGVRRTLNSQYVANAERNRCEQPVARNSSTACLSVVRI